MLKFGRDVSWVQAEAILCVQAHVKNIKLLTWRDAEIRVWTDAKVQQRQMEAVLVQGKMDA